MIKWFQRKKKNQEVEEQHEEIESVFSNPKREKEKVDLTRSDQRIRHISNLHEEIKEAKQQCEDAKFEYGQVTSYLKDIQLIDAASKEEKEVLISIAEGIAELTKERYKRSTKKFKVSDEQKRMLEFHEDIVEDDIKKLLEYEAYQIKIKNDMQQLASEKNMLEGDKKDITASQKTLRTITKSMAMIMVMMSALFAVVFALYEVDVTVPFLLLVAFCMTVIAYIVVHSNRNRVNMVQTERKCNRAILLTNKVKIKYINNTNVIQYMSGKYRVRNGIELEFVYQQYMSEKRELSLQQEGTRLLAEYHKVLIHELNKLGVKDKEIWFHQALALVENREMVEVRHELNNQRKLLRERMDYNTKIMEDALTALEAIRSKNAEYAEDVERILQKGSHFVG